MNAFKQSLRGIEGKAGDVLVSANSEARVAFQRNTQPDPDVSLVFFVTYMQGITSHSGRTEETFFLGHV